ncbi:TatD family deoxyribonuclease [Bailinhaonella thermotolerans]|uniref:TatD family deoxyribonuclease n=1 Tax=Bailinhaonella thermotolerans TaxID=1070861 RepID=A0A3A4B0Z1_9ACTN|nr:TatD family deoxyribonuclease [Bailinhaonella thermotolerans]
MEELPPAPEPLAREVFDSHCHLDIQKVDVPEMVAAARAVGVRRLVTVGYDLPSSRWCAEAGRLYDDVYGAVAIHPNEAHTATDEVLAEIEELASRDEVRAVGETGLDYYRDWSPVEEQRRAFREHIGIAKRTGKALVIHDRDAHDDVLKVLAEEGAPDKVVFHCFSGGPDLARACADAGYFMSFAGTVTYKNAPALREAAAIAPPELILVETDAPYLPPVPYRGKTNASHLIPLTVRRIAEVKSMDEATLCEAITRNGEAVFGPW